MGQARNPVGELDLHETIVEKAGAMPVELESAWARRN